MNSRLHNNKKSIELVPICDGFGRDPLLALRDEVGARPPFKPPVRRREEPSQHQQLHYPREH